MAKSPLIVEHGWPTELGSVSATALEIGDRHIEINIAYYLQHLSLIGNLTTSSMHLKLTTQPILLKSISTFMWPALRPVFFLWKQKEK